MHTKRTLVDKIFSFFWLQLIKKRITLIISVNEIHAVELTPYIRQVYSGYAKSLYRPVARNRIKHTASERRREREKVLTF